MKENFSTEQIKIPEKVVDQVIGQEEAVEIIKKAAFQRRHVLLIGEPGTGKSLLGIALAELLPKSKVTDLLSYPNINDDNKPIIKEVPSGKGRAVVREAQLNGSQVFKNQNMLMFVLAIVAIILPIWARHYYLGKEGSTAASIMFTALFLGSMVFLGAFVIFLSMGQRTSAGKSPTPKLIVDNSDQKNAPFFDATGSHAGALLGDVLHDPFQSFWSGNKLLIKDDKLEKEIGIQLGPYFKRFGVLRKQEKNYEATFLSKNELSILGVTNNYVSSVDVLSCNRYDHDGNMIKLTTSENKELIVTPEHKIAVYRFGKIEYVEARNLKKNDEVVAQDKDILLDEQDIINTYNERQQEQCRLYYQYQKIKSENPTWGYKRIAKAMNQPIGKTRWWHAKKHIPVPIQTANWLKKKNLLPLTIENPNLQLIAKVLGATFGDGGVFENLNGIFLSSSELEAVKEFGSDLEKIFNLNKDENSRIFEGGEYGHSWCYQNTNRNLIRFFLAFGAPKGNKTNLNLKIPNWISLNSKFEDEFFGSLFGGEIGISKNKLGGARIEFGITGIKKLEDNRIYFLNEIINYLNKKEIKSGNISTKIVRGNEDSLLYRFVVSQRFIDSHNFLEKVKLNYCYYKANKLNKCICKYIQKKYREYYQLREKGYGAEKIMDIFQIYPRELYLILGYTDKINEAIA